MSSDRNGTYAAESPDGIEAIERGLDAGHELATIARDNAAEADKWRKVAERLSTSVAVAHWHMLVVHGHEPSDGYIERGAQVELAEVLTAVEQEADHE